MKDSDQNCGLDMSRSVVNGCSVVNGLNGVAIEHFGCLSGRQEYGGPTVSDNASRNIPNLAVGNLFVRAGRDAIGRLLRYLTNRSATGKVE